MNIAIILAASTAIATVTGGYLAIKSKDRLHLVLGLSAGLLLGFPARARLPIPRSRFQVEPKKPRLLAAQHAFRHPVSGFLSPFHRYQYQVDRDVFPGGSVGIPLERQGGGLAGSVAPSDQLEPRPAGGGHRQHTGRLHRWHSDDQ